MVYMKYVLVFVLVVVIFFFKQKTAYEMRISDWSSDVCSSDLGQVLRALHVFGEAIAEQETGLAAITTEVKAGTAPGLGQRGEIDECGEVLQARQQVRIGMRAVPVMADQCAIAAFGQIVFTTRIAVVGEQHRALVQQAADRKSTRLNS